MTTATDQEKKHVAVILFPSWSHNNSVYNLTLKLAHAAPKVSFSLLGTEPYVKPLASKPNNPQNVQFYSISDGIPEGHVLGPNPVERITLFLKAGPENLHKGIIMAEEATKSRVTCIIADVFVVSSLTLAQNLSVPWVAVWPNLPHAFYIHFHTDLIRKECSTNDDPQRPLDFLPGMSKMVVEDLPDGLLINDDDRAKMEEAYFYFAEVLASFGRVLPQAKAVVMAAYEVAHSVFVEDMRAELNTIPLLCVGYQSHQVPPPPLPPSESDETGCLSWLDKQPPRSVAYFSLGTVVSIPPHEIPVVAEALEESGFPFLWTLKDHFKSLLPEGFLERIHNQGKVVPWVNQSQILKHGSIGVFVNHGGYNSVSESICCEVPLICRPFFADTNLGAKWIDEMMGIGVTVEGRVFTKSGLIKSLNMVLVQKEGEKLRENLREQKRIVFAEAANPQGKANQDFNTLVQLVSN